MTDCCGQPSFCEKPCFHDCGRSTPGRAGAVAGVLEERGKRYGDFEGHAAISQSLKDAMRTTPRAMKEASLALGATQWQTIYKVIIPYSISGITSAVVLGIGRAIGETMAVLMVTGNAAVIPTSFFEPVRTIPATIAAELGEAPAGGAHYEALFLLGAVLFLITLILSISVEYISSKRKI